MSEKQKTAIGAMLTKIKTATQNNGSEVRQLRKNDQINAAEIHHLTSSKIFDDNTIVSKINTSECTLWRFKDRPSCDLGDLDQLAQDIILNGQSQPGIVRPILNSNSELKYEIIVGERRWRACNLAKLPFQAIIKFLDDHDAALVQASENLQRKDLSDYAKGMNYFKLINEGVITQTELQKSLGMTKATMSALLSFGTIPKIIMNSISDPSKISGHVASIIRAYANKGDDMIQTLITLAPQISSGIGGETLRLLMSKRLSNIPSLKSELLEHKDKKNNIVFQMKVKDGLLSQIRFTKPTDQIDAVEKFLESLLHTESVRRAELETKNK
jgi:ParB family chromosome partitioning protein